MESGCRAIKVYTRLKPFDESQGSGMIEYGIYDRVGADSKSCLKSIIIFNSKPSSETINNKVDHQTFRVFDQDSEQCEIYNIVAKPVVDSVLDGYNGTVFAYGQTGSGKTYSIAGGTEVEDQGIIPRSIQHVFESVRRLDTDAIVTIYISYCEIYNETGYDLLEADTKSRNKLDDLRRFTISEDVQGNLQFRNLSLKKIETPEQALNLLLLGDSNRMTSETPINKLSSRSHCVFTIVIATQSDSSGVVRRAKLNLVDLAGSERVSKTGINGKTLDEAKHINLSLHYLEQVIVSLNPPERKHIPYRNSMITMVLKDSLGGNCLTTMLATLAAEQDSLLETISTCRFAQRVALIENEIFANEASDPQCDVKILKEDIKALKTRLTFSSIPIVKKELTPSEIAECNALVKEILTKEHFDAMPRLPPDIRKTKLCMWLLKCAATEASVHANNNANENATTQMQDFLAPSCRERSSSTEPPSRVDVDKLTESTGDQAMDAFIAATLQKMREEERAYRTLLASDSATPKDNQNALMEQIEISKLKMLSDFRALAQEKSPRNTSTMSSNTTQPLFPLSQTNRPSTENETEIPPNNVRKKWSEVPVSLNFSSWRRMQASTNGKLDDKGNSRPRGPSFFHSSYADDNESLTPEEAVTLPRKSPASLSPNRSRSPVTKIQDRSKTDRPKNESARSNYGGGRNISMASNVMACELNEDSEVPKNMKVPNDAKEPKDSELPVGYENWRHVNSAVNSRTSEKSRAKAKGQRAASSYVPSKGSYSRFSKLNPMAALLAVDNILTCLKPFELHEFDETSVARMSLGPQTGAGGVPSKYKTMTRKPRLENSLLGNSTAAGNKTPCNKDRRQYMNQNGTDKDCGSDNKYVHPEKSASFISANRKAISDYRSVKPNSQKIIPPKNKEIMVNVMHALYKNGLGDLARSEIDAASIPLREEMKQRAKAEELKTLTLAATKSEFEEFFKINEPHFINRMSSHALKTVGPVEDNDPLWINRRLSKNKDARNRDNGSDKASVQRNAASSMRASRFVQPVSERNVPPKENEKVCKSLQSNSRDISVERDADADAPKQKYRSQSAAQENYSKFFYVDEPHLNDRSNDDRGSCSLSKKSNSNDSLEAPKKKYRSQSAARAQYDKFFYVDLNNRSNDNRGRSNLLKRLSNETVAKDKQDLPRNPGKIPAGKIGFMESSGTVRAFGVKERIIEKSEKMRNKGELCLTGDQAIDEEILEFYKSRHFI